MRCPTCDELMTAAPGSSAPCKACKWRERFEVERTSWGTPDELRFIDGLGTYRPGVPESQWASYTASCLRGYIDGAEKRTAWGDVDGGAALARARELLALTVEQERAGIH